MQQSKGRVAKKIQSVDVVVIGILWSSLAVIMGIAATSLVTDEDVRLAQSRSHSLAVQLLNDHDLKGDDGNLVPPQSDRVQARGPASTESKIVRGTIGLDSWGRPFQYAKIENTVVVWSTGPDGISSSEASLDANDGPHAVSSSAAADSSAEALGQDSGRLDFQLLGDDVGSVLRATVAAQSNP